MIDREVFAKLRSLGVAPSGPASDAEFLRRVTLDVIGTLPSPQEVRAFLGDRSRGQAVEEDRRAARAPDARRALGHAVPRHHRLRRRVRWKGRTTSDPAGRRCGTTGSASGSPRTPRTRRSPAGSSRRRAATASDADAWVAAEAARMIALKNGAARATTRPSRASTCTGGGSPAASTSRSSRLAERTAAAFLGVRIECAQCHKHPFDRWTQADYRAFANVFADVQFGLSPEGLSATARLLEAAAEVGPERHAAADSPAERDLRLRASFAAAGRPRNRPAARAQGARRAGAARLRRPARAALRLADASPTTRTSPAASSTASGPFTSESGWSTPSTASRSPTRPRTPGCSTPWRPTSSRTATTSAGWSDRSSTRAPTSGRRSPATGTSTTTATSPAPSRGR